MAFVSVTRLRLRSPYYLLSFGWQAILSARQANHSAGLIKSAFQRKAKNAFWTLTLWQDEASMKAYRNSGVHGKVMPKLLDWCDEASVVHWHQESLELPTWSEAEHRMRTEGKFSKVKHPSSDHAAKQFTF